MQKIEENLEIMIQLQKRSQAEIQADINCVKEHQNATKDTNNPAVGFGYCSSGR